MNVTENPGECDVCDLESPPNLKTKTYCVDGDSYPQRECELCRNGIEKRRGEQEQSVAASEDERVA